MRTNFGFKPKPLNDREAAISAVWGDAPAVHRATKAWVESVLPHDCPNNIIADVQRYTTDALRRKISPQPFFEELRQRIRAGHRIEL